MLITAQGPAVTQGGMLQAANIVIAPERISGVLTAVANGTLQISGLDGTVRAVETD